MVLERLSWRVTCLSHGSFRLLTVVLPEVPTAPGRCLMLQVGETEKFPQALGFESLDPFFFFFSQSASRAHVAKPQRRMGVTGDLYGVHLLVKWMVLPRQVLHSLAIAVIAEAVLMRLSVCRAFN